MFRFVAATAGVPGLPLSVAASPEGKPRRAMMLV